MNNMWLRADDGAAHPSSTASTPCIKIDKGVPIPRPVARAYSPEGRALDALKIGESFVWPKKKYDDIETVRKRMRAAAFKRKPKKFASRLVEENDKRIIRVWRVA